MVNEYKVIVAILAIVSLKVFALYLGFRIVQLGYDALARGIKGEFDFQGKIKNDLEFKLVSASPGLFFVLLGTSLMGWALFVEKPVETWSRTVERGDMVDRDGNRDIRPEPFAPDGSKRQQ